MFDQNCKSFNVVSTTHSTLICWTELCSKIATLTAKLPISICSIYFGYISTSMLYVGLTFGGQTRLKTQVMAGLECTLVFALARAPPSSHTGLDKWGQTPAVWTRHRPNFIWELYDDDDQDVNREIFASCKICKSSPLFCNVVLGPFEACRHPRHHRYGRKVPIAGECVRCRSKKSAPSLWPKIWKKVQLFLQILHWFFSLLKRWNSICFLWNQVFS